MGIKHAADVRTGALGMYAWELPGVYLECMSAGLCAPMVESRSYCLVSKLI